LRLTTSEDDNGGVVASITHKLHQRVSVVDAGNSAAATGGHWQLKLFVGRRFL
jgi:hypothetical protein